MEPRQYGPFPFSGIDERPPLKWPNGAKVALWVVPNVEVFHLNVALPGDNQNRPTGAEPVPMVREWAQRDFGNRVGIWRVMRILEKHGVRATVALNSDICDHMPSIVEAAGRLKWEIMGHGRTNTHRVNEIPPQEERALVDGVFETIERATGKRPNGWLGAGLQETWNTLDYLLDNGCHYIGDWVNDDQPYLMDLDGRKLVSMPYSFELNDSAFFWRNKQSVPEFERMIRDALEVLLEEGATSGRVMCISLHPFIIGQAHRIGVLDRCLSYILSHDDVWAATGSEIMEAWLEATGTSLT